jgi:hypothetical protein
MVNLRKEGFQAKNLFLCEIANKIAYANAQGYVCYHCPLVKMHQNRYFGNNLLLTN